MNGDMYTGVATRGSAWRETWVGVAMRARMGAGMLSICRCACRW